MKLLWNGMDNPFEKCLNPHCLNAVRSRLGPDVDPWQFWREVREMVERGDAVDCDTRVRGRKRSIYRVAWGGSAWRVVLADNGTPVTVMSL
jgi:hypothetical protein